MPSPTPVPPDTPNRARHCAASLTHLSSAASRRRFAISKVYRSQSRKNATVLPSGESLGSRSAVPAVNWRSISLSNDRSRINPRQVAYSACLPVRTPFERLHRTRRFSQSNCSGWSGPAAAESRGPKSSHVARPAFSRHRTPIKRWPWRNRNVLPSGAQTAAPGGSPRGRAPPLLKRLQRHRLLLGGSRTPAASRMISTSAGRIV